MLISVFLALALVFQNAPANHTIDSLNKRLEISEGNERVIILNELYKQYVNNDPIKALEYTTMALELAQQLEDSSGMASSYNNIGVLNKNRGNLDDALASYLESVKIQQANKYVDALAFTYNNIGTIYSLKGEYEKALVSFNQALEQFEEIGHKLMMIGTLNNIGNVYTDLGEYDYALQNYMRSLQLYEELEDNSKAFVPFNNIGNIYYQKGEWDNALAYYESALDLERLNNDKNGQANALHNIGTVHKTTKNFDDALATFTEALSLVQETDNKRLQEIIYLSMAEAYFEKGDTFLAYSFLKLHNNAKEQVFNELSTKRIAELENSYELEKKEAQIEALKVESQLQQLQIQNDKLIIVAIIIVAFLVVGLSVVIWRELNTIKRNKKLLESQNEELERQKLIIQEKNQSITESIDYAKSVQKSMLQFAVPASFQDDFFIVFKPKDIVSGDFYWFSEVGGKHIVAAADCTGHGVAGAFMTVIGHSSLEQIVNRDGVNDPADILEKLDEQVSKALSHGDAHTSDHGMELALCTLDREGHKLTFTGANRPLYRVHQGELLIYKGTKRAIGDSGSDKAFDVHQIDYQAGDTFYMFSDGFPYQFGGDTDKKYMISNFKKLILQVHHLPMQQQQAMIKDQFHTWKGTREQTDDVLVLGFKV